MSIMITKVENTSHYNFTPRMTGFVRAEIDPKTTNKLPFPSDYKYFSMLGPKQYALWANRVQQFKVRPDDIWILGFPKTGTTWTQNIVYQMKSLECKDYFHPDINFFDSPYTLEKDKNDEEICKLVEKREKLLDELDALPSPRMIKSHLMAFLLPKQICTVQPKMIYLSRDVKDTALSLYHMMTIMNYVGESAHDFFTSFRDDIVAYGPFYEHIGSFTQLRHLKHLLFLTYEELSANPFECVKKVNNFLECDYSDTQLQQLVEHVSFEKMKGKFGLIANSNFEFCRKGKVGGYKEVE